MKKFTIQVGVSWPGGGNKRNEYFEAENNEDAEKIGEALREKFHQEEVSSWRGDPVEVRECDTPPSRWVRVPSEGFPQDGTWTLVAD